MGKANRGLASIDVAKRRMIARKRRVSAHRLGKAHTWTSAEARRKAGKKGGLQKRANS